MQVTGHEKFGAVCCYLVVAVCVEIESLLFNEICEDTRLMPLVGD